MKFPAPWKVDSYQSQAHQVVWEVRDVLGNCVVAGIEKERAEAIVQSRNAGTVLEDIKQLTQAYQGAIDTLNADIVVIRQRWQEELAERNAQIDRYRNEIAAVKKERGLLI